MNYDAVEAYDIPFGDVEKKVISWVEEALELRHGTAGFPESLRQVGMDEGLHVVMDELVKTRNRADRVDGLLAKVTQAKGRARRAQEGAAFAASKAYDDAHVDGQNTRLPGSFLTKEEKNAEAALKSFEQRRVAHQAERLVSITSEAYEIINQVHWQLNAIRTDLRAQIHAIQFENSLER